MKYYEIPGWFNGHEQYDKAVDYCPQNGKILEIGCFYGRSTHYMCSNIVNTNRKDISVYCIDTFQDKKHLDTIIKKKKYSGLLNIK